MSEKIQHYDEPLCLIDIKFDDNIRALLLLSLLSENWDGLVTTMSNSLGNLKLKFDDILS